MLSALAPRELGSEVVLRSAVEHRFRAVGARVERRGAWRVVAAVEGEDAHLLAVGFADASNLAKLEVRGGTAPADRPDRAVVEIAPDRWIVLCAWERRAALADELGRGLPRLVADLSGAWTLLLLGGPQADRLLRRLGPIAAVPGAGPVAEVPGRVTRRGQLLWVLVPAEYAQHVWDVCADLVVPLGGGPAGLDAVARMAGDPLLEGS